MNRLRMWVLWIICLGLVGIYLGKGEAATAKLSAKDLEKAWEKAEQLIENEQYEEAAQLYDQIAATEQAAKKPNPEDVAEAFDWAGYCYQQLGHNEAARERYTQAVAWYRQANNQEDLAIALNALGEIYIAQGLPDQALEHYEQALAIHRQLQDQAEIADDCSSIGWVYQAWGQYDKALAQFEQALAIHRQLQDQAEIADDLNDTGWVYQAWGQYDKALAQFEQALAISTDLQDQAGIAWNFNGLGQVYQARGEYDKALAQFEQALAIHRQLKDREGISDDLSYIGRVYQAQGQYANAIEQFEQVLALDRSLENPEWIAIDLKDIGELYRLQGQYDHARELLEQALTTFQQMKARAYTAEVLTNLGKLHQAQQNYADAIASLMKAVEIKEQLRLTATGDARRDYLASQIETYQLLIACYVATGEFVKAIETIELTRDKVLLEQIAGARQDALKSFSLEQLQQHLPEDTAILIYAEIQNNRLIQITVTSTTITASERATEDVTKPILEQFETRMDAILGENAAKNPFAKTIQYYRELLNNQWPIEALSGQLYTFLIKTAQSQIADKSHLIIVPDGMLNFLPFETLFDEQGKYLVETYRITYAQSLSMLEYLRQRNYSKIERKPMIAFGGATYEEPIEPYEGQTNAAYLKYVRQQVDEATTRGASLRKVYVSLLGIAWKPLRGTLKEAAEIALIVPDVSVITGPQVNETTVKQWSADGTLAQYRMLHFATHGMVDTTIPELSALVLSQSAKPRTETEDDYLRIGEVAQLELQADLVTLSACETGLGKLYSGQSVVGLPQSFLLAGANGLTVSLWQVADEATAKMMTTFYQTIVAGKHSSEALTDVKRRFIAGEFGKEWAHPYYWAPFVYYGKE